MLAAEAKLAMHDQCSLTLSHSASPKWFASSTLGESKRKTATNFDHRLGIDPDLFLPHGGWTVACGSVDRGETPAAEPLGAPVEVDARTRGAVHRGRLYSAVCSV